MGDAVRGAGGGGPRIVMYFYGVSLWQGIGIKMAKENVTYTLWTAPKA